MNGQTDSMPGQTVGLLVALGLGLLGFLLASQFFIQQHAILVACIVFLVTLWTNEALPLGAVSLLPLLLFPATGLIDMKAVAVNYSNPIIFLFLGGFLLAIATQKTGLHKILAHKILNIFPATPQGIIYSLLFASSLLSAFLSNTTTALLLISIALFLTNDDRLKIRLVLAVAYGASVGGIITPIGTPPNLILMGFLDGQGLPALGFMQWVFLTFPLAVLMLIAVGFVLSRGVADCTAIDLDHHDEMTLPQKKLAWVLVALVILLLVNSPIRPVWDGLGINEKGILLAFGLAMFFPGLGFLEWQDSKKNPLGSHFPVRRRIYHCQRFSENRLCRRDRQPANRFWRTAAGISDSAGSQLCDLFNRDHQQHGFDFDDPARHLHHGRQQWPE